MSSEEKKALAKLWKHYSFRIDSLSERIRLQKTVYLLSILGYPHLDKFRASYSMYIYGPYSPVLAKEVYSLASEGVDSAEPLSASESAIIAKLDEIIVKVPRVDGDPSYACLELLSNIIYFKKSERPLTSEELYRKIEMKKPYLAGRARFDSAEKLLIENHLL